MAEEDCSDTWEDLEDSGELDKRLKKIEVRKEKSQTNSSQASSTLLFEDTSRSTYQPQVRILKRNTNPTGHNQTKQDNSGQQNKGRWRPLPEREKDYAAARMRIFGKAEPEEQQQAAQSSTELYSESNVSKQLQTLKVTDSVDIIRQPKGPDGSKGFVHR